LERSRRVSNEEGETYAKSIGAEFFSTSAKANKCVEAVFVSVAKRLEKKHRGSGGAAGASGGAKSGRTSLKIADEDAKPKSGECC
jgi:Ras-related protein Rab-21